MLDLISHLRDCGSNRDCPASKALERTSLPQDGADCIRCGCLRLDQQRAIAGTGRAFTWGLPCEVRKWRVIDGLAVALVHPLAMPAVYPIRGPSAKILPFRTDWDYLRRRGANAAQMPYMLPIGEEHTDAGSSLVMCQKLLSTWSCLDDHHWNSHR